MSGCNLSIDDIRFRKRSGDECDIVVHGQTVGIVTRRPDPAAAGSDRFCYALHLYDDRRGPLFVDDRRAVRPAIARMLVERDLVPWSPPPMHPEHAARQHSSV